MANPVSPRLPFRVTPFTNPSGTVVWRVSGSWEGERTRKNFVDRAEADALCNQKNAEAMAAIQAPRMRLVQTRLSDAGLAAAEAGEDRAEGRWSLARIIDVGLARLAEMPAPEPVRPLLDEWLKVVKGEVDDRWYAELKGRNGMVLKKLMEPTTGTFTREKFREWLDGSGLSAQSRANYRNAVHRFGAWLIERGKIARDANPGSGIRISKRRKVGERAAMPAVFLAVQAEAYLRAVESAECRRLKGWAVLCLLCGLRPESEAERLTWAEIDLEVGELTVMGRKRGARPRVVKLQPLAIAWLRSVKADKEETPGPYWRHLRVRATERANAWLAEHHPAVPAIEWDGDIQRHTYISMRAGQGVAMHALAEEVGNSPGAIYSHYRNPRPAAEVTAFWCIRPLRD